MLILFLKEATKFVIAIFFKFLNGTLIFSSPEPKAQGELIVWDSSRRPSVSLSVRATDMDLGAFLVVWT